MSIDDAHHVLINYEIDVLHDACTRRNTLRKAPEGSSFDSAYAAVVKDGWALKA